MTTDELVIALWSIASIAIYIGFCMWLASKSKNIPLERVEEQDDERGQRRHF